MRLVTLVPIGTKIDFMRLRKMASIGSSLLVLVLLPPSVGKVAQNQIARVDGHLTVNRTVGSRHGVHFAVIQGDDALESIEITAAVAVHVDEAGDGETDLPAGTPHLAVNFVTLQHGVGGDVVGDAGLGHFRAENAGHLDARFPHGA